MRISPFLIPRCRYESTCSEFTKIAINRFGVVGGIWISLKRIARCNPFGGCGFDPVPKKINNGSN